MQTVENVKKAFLEGRDGSKVPQELFQQLAAYNQKRMEKTKEIKNTEDKKDLLVMDHRLLTIEIQKTVKKINEYL